MIDCRRLFRPCLVSVWAVALLGVLGACLPGAVPAADSAIRRAASPVVPSPTAPSSPALASEGWALEPLLVAKERGRPTLPQHRSPPPARLIGLWLVPPRTASRPWPSFLRGVTLP